MSFKISGWGYIDSIYLKINWAEQELNDYKTNKVQVPVNKLSLPFERMQMKNVLHTTFKIQY